MFNRSVILAAFAILLWGGTGVAAPTAQQQCSYARMTAWKKYASCITQVLAKDVRGVIRDETRAFASCRHTYFRTWQRFQGTATLAGSACIGPRFTDNGDQTVTDNLSGLVWEKKRNLDGLSDDQDPHDADNLYSLAFGCSRCPGNGTAFNEFLQALNSGGPFGGFAGANDWRIPTLAELQTIILDFRCDGPGGERGCTCHSDPCIDPALDPSNTPLDSWSATVYSPYSPDSDFAWHVLFRSIYGWGSGVVDFYVRQYGNGVRAVRGGF
jgi:hypothetical protein